MAKKKRGGRVTTPLPKFSLRMLGDPALKRRAADIVTPTDADRRAIEAMTRMMYREGGLALAATQVGYHRRLFVYDDEGAPRSILDPDIVETAELMSTYHEGCLSIPGVFLDIPRSVAAAVVGMDQDGNEIELEVTGLLARVFQHEIDHLYGKTMVDAASPAQKAAIQQGWQLARQMRVPCRISQDGQVKLGEGVLADW